MKPAPSRTPAELLDWALAIIKRECASQIFGTITVHVQKGQIIRVTTERSEVPENSPPMAIDTRSH